MPTYIRIKDLPNSASSLNTDDYIMLSGAVAGARKILKADFMSTVADTLNATPNTYKLATLDASNKVDSSQWPASAFSYQGTWAASTNTPTLADGTGTSGYTYYASDSGSVNFGAGAISFTAGDAVVYDGSIWQKVPDVANILDGKGTVDEGKTTLEIPNVGTAANEVPLCGMLNSGAWVDWDSHYEAGTWSGSVQFGGASVGQTYSTNNCNFTRTGNVVHVQGILTLSSKGSSTGTARIAGLPFTSSAVDSQAGLSINYGTGFASLTGLPSALVSASATTALLSNWGASGVTVLTEANFTDVTSIRFSGTYQIA